MRLVAVTAFIPFACFIGAPTANSLFFIAFILYRQHYQGQVIAQNPGLANPDISKIIGAQWREQPIEVQNEWKRLAEVSLPYI